jgi:sulfoxide reductase heme-binding subunit YedZ
MGWLRANSLRVFVHAAAWLPLVWIALRLVRGELTANPIREIQLETGRLTLTILLVSLACSPLHNLTGFAAVHQVRRTTGLYAFMYACLHFLNFAGVDYAFNVPLILNVISDRKFPLAGIASFLCLIPAALTSTKAWFVRLGKNWKRLHRLVYFAAAAGVTHYFWAAKAQPVTVVPLIYGAVLIVLLIVRIPVIRDAMRRPASPS